MSDLLARVAAIAEREQAKTRVNRDQMREQHPELAAQVDALRAVFGQPHAVSINGARYGKPEMWFRRTMQHQPPIPGVTNASDSGLRAGQSGGVARKNRGLHRVKSNGRDAAPNEARPWWDADADGDEAGGDV